MQILLYVAAIAGLLVFACPILFLGIGVNFGNLTGLVVSAVFLAFARHGSAAPLSFSGNRRWVVFVFWCLFGIGVIIGLLESLLMLRGLRNTPAPKEDLPVLILGCGVEKGKPSTILRERLDTALQYLEEHPESSVIVCGGKGPDELISEAECMAVYLEEHGIEAGRIHREDASRNTRENLANAAVILEREQLGKRAVVVTSDFHCFRAIGLAADNGITAFALPARTFWLFLPTYWVREWYGILYQTL